MGVAAATVALLLFAVRAHAAFSGHDGQIAWSYSISADPSQAGSYGVLLENPRTAKGHGLRGCNYSADVGPHCPEWSSVAFAPSGSRALWVTVPNADSANPGVAAITVMNSGFSAPVAIDHPGESDTDASFSPDGKRIIYVRTIHGPSRVVTSNLTGGDVRVVRGVLSHAKSPEFFPNGRAILFAHNKTIWSVRSDGRNARPIVSDGTAPDISPDGRLIAYIGVKSGSIFIARSDGTHQRKVSLQGALCRPPRCTGAAQAVVFSPDGTKLAFAWSSDPAGTGDPTLYTVSVTGGRIRQIDSVFTDDAGGDTTGLSWQPLH